MGGNRAFISDIRYNTSGAISPTAAEVVDCSSRRHVMGSSLHAPNVISAAPKETRTIKLKPGETFFNPIAASRFSTVSAGARCIAALIIILRQSLDLDIVNP